MNRSYNLGDDVSGIPPYKDLLVIPRDLNRLMYFRYALFKILVLCSSCRFFVRLCTEKLTQMLLVHFYTHIFVYAAVLFDSFHSLKFYSVNNTELKGFF